jgi:membrane protein implicated in regulation of membrane protease activity
MIGQWLWLILTVVFVLIESLSMALITIWFAVGSLAALLFAWLGAKWGVQITVFLVTSFVLLFSTKTIAEKYLKIGKVKTNVNALIGTVGVVTERIEALKYGKVDLAREIWTAKSHNAADIIEADQKVIVTGIEGSKLVVRRYDE